MTDQQNAADTNQTATVNSKDTNIVKSSNSTNSQVEEKTPFVNTLQAPSSKQETKTIENFNKLADRQILIDTQNANLKQIVQQALNQISFNESWTVKWRLKDENKYILDEKMNLTAELTFNEFMSNMVETIANITGIKLTTKVFDKNKVIIIIDSF